MKRTLSVILMLTLVLAVVLDFAPPAAAESLYIRKVVSVVYDDSGSMDGDKWAYANYAMQAFCGMLNSEDQLFVTYMSHTEAYSNYDPKQVDLSAGGIQSSVDAIRNHRDQGSTPYGAVETAFQKLQSVNDSNPNTQYWLVVITDGAFNEMGGMDAAARKRFLNDKFRGYTQSVMPNGTNPQVTFLGIGGVVPPDEDHSKGIYTYSAKNAAGITDAMSEMADRISGRTRLQQKDIKQIDDSTIQVSSSIPLLNIAVFAQKSDAVIEKAVYSNEMAIPISRKVSLGYPNYADLVGGAYLLGDSQQVIGSGTYNITFNKKVSLEDVIILFEPALEMRMKVTLNGKEITDYTQLDDAMEGDKLSISCKIYEMGTDREVDPALLPPGTKFQITISEDGKVVEQATGQEMLLEDYVLKHIETEITAAVIIEGFNPIDYSERFTPVKYVPRIVYSITPSFGSDVKNVKFDEIANNQDLTICFTVLADGVPMTDSNAVKALNPVITTSPQGNGGTISYSRDGKLVFTPNTASIVAGSDGSFDVQVTCTLADGTSATETYTVLLADYQVIAVDSSATIKKTEFYGNQVGVSFYITKDGVQMDKAAVEKHISVVLDDAHKDFSYLVNVSNDGMITVVPYTGDEWNLHFGTWWLNGWRYLFALNGSDISVMLNHNFGNATSVIDVVEEDLGYILLNVAAPILLELTIITLIAAYIYCVLVKPKFGRNAVIYSGKLYFDAYSNTHEITGMRKTSLAKFNKFKYRSRFTTKSQTVTAGDVKVSALKGGQIECYELGPVFKGNITFKHDGALQHPADILRYCRDFGVSFSIEPFMPIDTIAQASVGRMGPTNAMYPTYFIAGAQLPAEGEAFVIQSGKIFVYLTEV